MRELFFFLMDQSFDRYGLACLLPQGTDDPGCVRHFLPDSFLHPLEIQLDRLNIADERRQLVQAGILQTVDGRTNRIVLPRPAVPIDRSIAMVRDVLAGVDGRFRAGFDGAVARGEIEWARPGAPGLSGGRCWMAIFDKKPERADGRAATIEMQPDGTVNDPAYLAHEAGHYIAALQGPAGGPEGVMAWYVFTETQAFFLQHRFYAWAARHGDPGLRQAASLQRAAERLTILDILKANFEALPAIQNDPTGEAYAAELAKPFRECRWIHHDPYPPAYFIAAGLSRRFERMEPGERTRLLAALYPASSVAEKDVNALFDGLFAAAGAAGREGFERFYRDAIAEECRDMPLANTQRSPVTAIRLPSGPS